MNGNDGMYRVLRIYCLSAVVVSTSKSRKSTAKNFAENTNRINVVIAIKRDVLFLRKFFRLVVDFADKCDSYIYRLLHFLVLFFVLPKGNINSEV